MQSFSEITLSTQISKAIADLGFEKPSPIQAQTLPLLLGDRTDFIGLAATGTGKTAAFAIPLLEKIDPSARGVQALILCPTRELALQVATQINLIGRYKRVKSVAVYGGSSYADQIRGLRDGAQVVVGTPGRVVDHIERGTLRLETLKTLVLDEADEMISMGFKDELEKILSAAPREESNIWLFSATMSREVRKVADTYLRSPQQVQVNREEMLSSTIEQYYYPAQEGNKPEILLKLIEGADDFYGLVFCQTKSLVVDLTAYLSERGYKVDSLHGDKDQTARERTMQAFRNRRVNILVCTDVASRGLDVKDITHVVNYSLPRELENYVHRIGRTARSGKTGIAMNLVTLSHRRLIYAIENLTKSKMIEGRIPTRREIGARKVAKRLESFNAQPFFSRATEVMSDEWKTTLASMAPEEIAGRFLTMMMPEVFNDRVETAANPGVGGVSSKVPPYTKAFLEPKPRSASARPTATFASDEPAVASARAAGPVARPISKSTPAKPARVDGPAESSVATKAPSVAAVPAPLRPAAPPAALPLDAVMSDGSGTADEAVGGDTQRKTSAVAEKPSVVETVPSAPKSKRKAAPPAPTVTAEDEASDMATAIGGPSGEGDDSVEPEDFKVDKEDELEIDALLEMIDSPAVFDVSDPETAAILAEAQQTAAQAPAKEKKPAAAPRTRRAPRAADSQASPFAPAPRSPFAPKRVRTPLQDEGPSRGPRAMSSGPARSAFADRAPRSADRGPRGGFDRGPRQEEARSSRPVSGSRPAFGPRPATGPRRMDSRPAFAPRANEDRRAPRYADEGAKRPSPAATKPGFASGTSTSARSSSRTAGPRYGERAEPRATVGDVTRELMKRTKSAEPKTKSSRPTRASEADVDSSATMNRRARRALMFSTPDAAPSATASARTGAKSSRFGEARD